MTYFVDALARNLFKFCITGFMLGCVAGTSMAQEVLDSLGGSDEPVSISAENGIEWDQAAKTYSAKGNVQASQGDFFVSSDVLKALYSEVKDGNPDVHTINASGNIYASFGTNELVGSNLEYKVKQQFATVTGTNILLQSDQGNLSANQKLIYDGVGLRAEAIGSPQISQGTNIVSADYIVAFFLPKSSANAQGGTGGTGGLRQVEANGGVFITNGSAVCRGEQASYDVVNERAVLSGNVSCSQCKNQLVGDHAEFDMKLGQARVESRKITGGNGRTFLLIDPKTPRDGRC
ncbi:MAG: LptA/OstA family protein [Alphaproteobacteria bacterium]